MFKKIILSLSLASLVGLSGCASVPESESKVEKLREQYENLADKQDANKYAPLALREAEDSLSKAEQLIDKGARAEQIEHQAYLAEKKIDIAREAIEMRRAEEILSSAGSRRQDVLLDARTRELREARQAASTMEERALAAEERADQIEARASSLEKEVADLSTQQTERGMVLTLGNILFELNKATLKSGAERTLGKVADFLNEYPDRKILVEGFTDSTGEEQYNKQLSEQRAASVKSELEAQGVDSNRVLTRGYGEKYPVASNDTKVGRQQNRRVEIIIGNIGDQEVQERETR